MFLFRYSLVFGICRIRRSIGRYLSFLIASPMINEVAVILLFGLFGWKTALIYVITGLVIAIAAGYIIGKLKLEHWVQDWVYQTKL